MESNLATTNVLLGVMAAVSILEALVLIGAGVGMFMLYGRVRDLVADLERKVTPSMTRVNAILDDVKDVTARVREETDRVDHAIRATMDRVDDTADRVRSNVREKTSQVIGLVRGLRVVIEGLLHFGSRSGPRGDGADRVM